MGRPLPPSRTEAPTTCELSPPQTESCSPHVSQPPLTRSTNNSNNSELRGPQERQEGAIHEGRELKGDHSQEPETPPENYGDGKGSPWVCGLTHVFLTCHLHR